MKKVLSVVMSGVLVAMLTSIPVSATTYTYTNGSKGISDPWQLADGGNDWTIEYGFNTAWINEDYTHTFHESKKHTAVVSNGKGTYTDTRSAGNEASIEITHKGTSVSYQIRF